MAAAPTKPQPTDADKAKERAKVLARREGYSIARVEMVFSPERGSDLWEVLFLGRYLGSRTANIRGDSKDARLAYCCWVRDDGTGYVVAGW